MSIIQYIEHLLVKANTLMDENLKRIARFEENLMKAVDWNFVINLSWNIVAFIDWFTFFSGFEK